MPPLCQRMLEDMAVRKLRQVRRREGRYLLRTNLTESDAAKPREFYLQLVEVEAAFETITGDLAIRPIYHQDEPRIEAHIFIAFLAYRLHVTLSQQLKLPAPGLTPRVVLEQSAAVQMIDVQIPTNDGRELQLTRYTQPEPELMRLSYWTNSESPCQPKLYLEPPPLRPRQPRLCNADLRGSPHGKSIT